MVGPGALVQVMDLLPPGDRAAVETLVERYAGDEPAILRRDFAASLRASITPDEVASQLHQAGLYLDVEVISDRHMLVTGRLPGP